jgi:carbonic anhydrase
MKTSLLSVSLLFLFCPLCLFQALPGLSAQEASGLTPDLALRRLKDGNDRFAADRLLATDLGTKKRQELAKGQHPFAVVLACADSRVAPEYVFNQGLGDLFVLRVAGNISDPFMIGSMEFAVEQLHVPLIVVLGHEECGAVKAALPKDLALKQAGNLGKLIDEVYVGKPLPADKNAALAAAIKNNVAQQTAILAKRSEVIKSHLEQKKLRIVSGVYSLATGKVEWLDSK